MFEASLNMDLFLFAILPYLSMSIFFLMTIHRYRAQSFTYSSLSSQFLENKAHFWGTVPFHYGILVILAGHVLGFLIPRHLLAWNSRPLRLYVLEVSALIFGLLSLIGLVNIIIRRVTRSKVRINTTPSDWILYGMLVIQLASGVYIAVFYGWGSSWFAASASPYIWSLIKFSPDIGYVVAMPAAVKLHIVSAYMIIAFFPFTRLVHILVTPNPYLWRKPQVVRWNSNRAPRRIR
ncbi:MAG: respiratory nitrate reductase subunit gamma [Planctomycetota bacterium]|jgi:nitrate reductase gamma subunit|nr:respiratory nitrate reductase subunit gamma [Planctomycetota bacterium]